jgi:hypothetical protein
MDQKSLWRCSIRLLISMWALGLSVGTQAQESLDRGKTPAQLFASDCSICHKSPQGLAKANGLLGLENFLREHYTASRESAAAIASYLRSVDSGPAARAKRAAKGDEKPKPDEKKKTGAKTGEPKATEKPDATSGEPKSPEAKTKPSEPKPAEIVAPEPKSESKPTAPAADEAKPAGGTKPEKSE